MDTLHDVLDRHVAQGTLPGGRWAWWPAATTSSSPPSGPSTPRAAADGP